VIVPETTDLFLDFVAQWQTLLGPVSDDLISATFIEHVPHNGDPIEPIQ
jgi:hypothetical protein